MPERAILEARQVSKIYRRGHFFERLETLALDRVNLRLSKRRSVALMGSSGSGKSTLARVLAGLESPTSGEVLYRGEPLSSHLSKRAGRSSSPVQLLMQDAASAIPFGFTVHQAIAEPLEIAGVAQGIRRSRALEMMTEVGLPEDLSGQQALALSGGQKQRLILARALLAEPRVLILDESLSGLDLSLRAQIANLLVTLQKRFDLSYLLIVHDLQIAAWLADEIVVMEAGRSGDQHSVHQWLGRMHQGDANPTIEESL